MSRPTRSLVLILCLAGVGCSRQQAASAPAPAYKVLASFPAGAASSLEYQLVIDSCGPDGCPVVVNLSRRGQVLDSAKLALESTSQEAGLEDVDAQWGAGDPLGAEPALKAWATGEEADYVATAARTVRITPERVGLLVTQRAGWEHMKHYHDLFLNDGAKIHLEWSAREGSGPTWSSTEAMPQGDGTEQILLYSGFQQADENKPDDLGVARVAWDRQQKKMVESPLERGGGIRTVAFGEYASIARARAVQQDAADCLSPLLWILDGPAYGDNRGRFLLGTITARPELAAGILPEGEKCSPPLKGKILAY